jgi:ligand-binding sensor domain-containing protein
MKSRAPLTFIILLLFFSCSSKKKQSQPSFTPKVVEAHGYVVPEDSIAEPTVIIPANAASTWPVEVVKPNVAVTNTNVFPAPIPIVVMDEVAEVCIPGQDGFSLPQTVPVVDSPFMAGIPKIVSARQPYAKEQNSQNFSSFGKLQGLKSDDISCFIEDKAGNLWIGSGTSGVTKYDGKDFTHFTANEGLSNNYVTSMLEDSSGNIWIGTTDGLNRYDGKNFTHFTRKEGLSNDFVLSIIADTKGNLWFGTEGGANRYDGNSFTHFTRKEGLSDDVVRCMVEDKSGNLWFGTEGGLSIYDGEKFSRLILKAKFPVGVSNIQYGVLNLLKDNSSNIWFTDRGGAVIKYDGKNFSLLIVKEGLTQHYVTCIEQDRKGNFWLGTFSGGVKKYDGKHLTSFSEKEGLSDKNVRCILEDKRGNLWFGTGKGVNRDGGRSITHYTVKEGLTNNNIRSILEDKSGNLWFGTDDGINKYDQKSFTSFDYSYLGTVLSMWQDRSGNFWFGSWGGVYRYDGKNFSHFFLNKDIYSIAEDKEGNIWLGSFHGGVFKYDGQRFTRFSEKEGLSNDIVLNMLADKKGHLWFGTYGGGLTEYDGQNFIHFTTKEGLKDNLIESMFEDKSGNLWLGFVNGGASKYDGKNFTNYTEKEGLTDNNVISITEDRDGNIWLGTAFGLNKLAKDKLYGDSGILFKSYTYENGFSGVDVYGRKGIFEAKDGTIWIGAKDMLTAFHPDEEITDTIPPNIVLTGLTLFNENIAWQNMLPNVNDTSVTLGNGVKVHDFHFDNVSKWYGVPENLSLPYNNNYLTFQFVGITTQSPKQVKYKYKLEGFDENWSALTNRSEATYGNLPHGKYTFKVKAINGDGYWSLEYQYSLSICPPWWHTWWAYTLFALSSAGIIYSIFRYRLNKIRMQHQLAVQQHKVTELEMQALRAQMNPHFIFNSLNSINLFILENNKLQASEYLSKFSRLVRLILNNSRETFIPLEHELEALELYLELESLRFDQRFEYEIEVDSSIDTSEIKVPPLIIQPYAENAIWHGLMNKKDKGHLEISLYQDRKNLFCKICDDGIGREKAADIRSKSTSTRKSVGMHITAERLAMFLDQGESSTHISVTDLLLPDGSAGGTEVIITIPFRS